MIVDLAPQGRTHDFGHTPGMFVLPLFDVWGSPKKCVHVNVESFRVVLTRELKVLAILKGSAKHFHP